MAYVKLNRYNRFCASKFLKATYRLYQVFSIDMDPALVADAPWMQPMSHTRSDASKSEYLR